MIWWQYFDAFEDSEICCRRSHDKKKSSAMNLTSEFYWPQIQSFKEKKKAPNKKNSTLSEFSSQIHISWHDERWSVNLTPVGVDVHDQNDPRDK